MSRPGRELGFFGGGFDDDPFGRMDEMMGGSMFGDDMFGDAFGRRRGGRGRNGEARDRGSQGRGGFGELMSMGGGGFGGGFGGMESMMNQMMSGSGSFGDGNGGAFYSSSSTMSFSSRDGKTQQYSSHTTSHNPGRGGKRVSETKSQYRNSDGIERAAWERSIDHQARMTIKERNRNTSGEVSTRERYHNLAAQDAHQFDNEFDYAAQHVRQLQQQAGMQRLGPGSSGNHGRRHLMNDIPGRHAGRQLSDHGYREGSRSSSRMSEAIPSSRYNDNRSRASSRGTSSSRASTSASWQSDDLGNID